MTEPSPPKPKRASGVKKTRKTAAQIRAEEELKWATWQKRVTSIALTIICLGAAFNELFLNNRPSEAKLIFIASVFGVNVLAGGFKGNTP